MANELKVGRLCRPVTEVPEYMVLQVRVGAGQTIYAGDIIDINGLDTVIVNNYNVFACNQPTTARLGRQMAIVINGGFEQLLDGRRPNGQPDYTQYSFTEGEIITVILLKSGVRFEISQASLTVTGTLAKGFGIFPVNGSFKPSSAVAVPSGTYSSLNVLQLKYFRAGGQNGAQFIPTVVAIVQQPTA